MTALRAAIHAYAAESSIALELGDVAEDLFQGARASVDLFVQNHCPAAAEQLVAIAERMMEARPEPRAEALTSCRRVLATVADAVFPPREGERKDLSGKPRKVGSEQYVNRLMAFIEERLPDTYGKDTLRAEVEHLAARLDALYAKTCKGVHASVGAEEARLVVIHTYLFLAEVARAASTVRAAAAASR